jgi:hypothetical protein
MSEQTDIEADLRAALRVIEHEVAPPAGLAERLLAVGAVTTAGRGTPHRVALRPSRWLPPLLAAAAVVAVVLSSLALTSSSQSQRPGRRPTVSPAAPTLPTASGLANPRPSSTASSALGSPTRSAPTTPSGSASRRGRGSTTGSGTASNAPAPPPTATPVPAGFYAADVQFTDPEHGWAIGNGACQHGSGPCAVVVRTQDGGAHWTAVATPAGLTPVDDAGRHHLDGGSCSDNGTIYGPCVDRVAFADARHGYLWSLHAVYLTDDAGRSWAKLPLRGAAQLVAAGSQVFAMVPIADCSSGCAGKLETAAVGSTSWRPVTLPSGAPGLFNSDLAQREGVAYFLASSGTGSGAQHLYRSANAGASWTLMSTNPCHASASFAGGSGLSVGWDGAVVLDCEVSGGAHTAVSTNGGRHFAAARVAPGDLVAAASARLMVSAHVDGVHTIVSGTTDGGAQWHTITEVDGQGPLVASFASATVGDVVVKAGRALLVTTDGGQQWRLQSIH